MNQPPYSKPPQGYPTNGRQPGRVPVRQAAPKGSCSPPQAAGKPQVNPPPPPRKGRGLKTILGLMALLVVVGVILQSTLFRVRSINVYGNVNLSAEEIVVQSGLAQGQNIFAINKEQVEERINANRYLKYQSLRRDYPDTVTLVVYERVPCATLQSLGIQYTLDKTGMVLEQTEQLTPMEGLVVLTGVQVEQATVGRSLILKSEQQLTACQGVLYELETQGMLREISELNVSDLDNLYLVSLDGFSIRLGAYEQIRAKLISFSAVHDELLRQGYTGGTIDVSAPIYPTYIP
ncbi:MAG: FtsQ-type POTRA domain-containing protein [Clostridia bacterium]|nr:FtsQ-type POTRA domain-containing protein [Clostridia bacterium]